MTTHHKRKIPKKGSGSLNVDNREGGVKGVAACGKKFLNVNIINFEKVDKPYRGGWTMWIRVFYIIF